MKVRTLTGIVDAHTHAIEYTEEDWRKIEELSPLLIVSVGEDLESSRRSVELKEERPFVLPCVGVHPWRVSDVSLSEVKAVKELAEDLGVSCIGEVGLDTKFVPETLERQRRVFAELVELAEELGAVLNVHAAGAWREVLEFLERSEIERAVFHWYTGPIDLLERAVERGFYFSINVAARLQERHRAVAKAVPLDKILTESDGPYEYRGARLSTTMIPDLVSLLAELRGEDEATLVDAVRRNARRLFG
ncbi:MAG: TatD family hydrolase [Fervidicoccaceae archaeon]